MYKGKDLTGKVFNGLIVLGFSHRTGGRVYWNVKCSCGKIRPPLRKDSLEKHTGRCTCPLEEGGIKGKLTYVKFSHIEGNKSYCEAICDCGKLIILRTDSFKSNTSGCGNCINKYIIYDNHILLDVSTDKYPNTFTKISTEDYNRIKHLKWYAIEGTRTLYVQASEGTKRVALHRLISECPDGLVVDHYDGDGLNNTRENLGIVDKRDNSKNLPIPSNNTSGHIGISLNKSGTYRAYITVDGVQIYLGSFNSYEDAVYSRKASEVLYGFHENHGRA